MNTEILGVAVASASRAEILAQVMTFFGESRFHRIATVNPEFLVMADYDPVFKQSLLSAQLCVADGIGIVLAGWLRRKNVTRFPGVDLLHEILTIAERDGHTVYLFIKKDGLSSYEEIRIALLKIYPALVVSGTDALLSGFENWKLEIGNSAIVLCNYGAPMQELFLANLKEAGYGCRREFRFHDW